MNRPTDLLQSRLVATKSLDGKTNAWYGLLFAVGPARDQTTK